MTQNETQKSACCPSAGGRGWEWDQNGSSTLTGGKAEQREQVEIGCEGGSGIMWKFSLDTFIFLAK